MIKFPKPFVAAVAGGSLLFTACGGGADETSEPTTSGPTTTTSSVEQVASVVARHERTLRELIAYEVDGCPDVAYFDCILPENLIARWEVIADEARAMFTDLRAVRPVPDELVGLFDETVRALSRVGEAQGRLQLCFINHAAEPIETCASDQNEAEAAWRALPTVLDAWAPYL
jgi:hypothetical protein